MEIKLHWVVIAGRDLGRCRDSHPSQECFFYKKMIQWDLPRSGDEGCTSTGSLNPESRERKNQSDHEMGMVRDGVGGCLNCSKSLCLLTNMGFGSVYVVEEYFFGLF